MKRAPRSRQRHDLYAKYHDYDSEISDLLGECGFTAENNTFGLQVPPGHFVYGADPGDENVDVFPLPGGSWYTITELDHYMQATIARKMAVPGEYLQPDARAEGEQLRRLDLARRATAAYPPSPRPVIDIPWA